MSYEMNDQEILKCEEHVASAFTNLSVCNHEQGTTDEARSSTPHDPWNIFKSQQHCILCLCYLSLSFSTSQSRNPLQLFPYPRSILYLSFFFGLNWFVWPHFFLRPTHTRQ